MPKEMNTATTGSRVAQDGDIVHLQLSLKPQNGFVPEPLLDMEGPVALVLGWGQSLPGLHALLRGCQAGNVVENVPLDAGWGRRRDDYMFQLSKKNLPKVVVVQKDKDAEDTHDPWQVGHMVQLEGAGNLEVLVTEVTKDYVVVDANNPLAGSSYACSFTVTSVEPLPSLDYQTATEKSQTEQNNGESSARIPGSVQESSNNSSSNSKYQVATFALGCFWGGDLAFSRVPGVIDTRVGYSQGVTARPTYEQVCTGRTQHREVVLVVYDPSVVSYKCLLRVAWQRLEQTTSSLELHQLFALQDDDDDDDDENRQYKHGFYYHNDVQRQEAQAWLDLHDNRYSVELLQASIFYPAEEYHQKYLFKGGQSARKGAKETIRCYG